MLYTCNILHNMIIKDEAGVICRYNQNENIPNVEGVGIGTSALDTTIFTLIW